MVEKGCVSFRVANTEDAAQDGYGVRRRRWLVLCSYSSDSSHSPLHVGSCLLSCCEADVTSATVEIGFGGRLNKEQ